MYKPPLFHWTAAAIDRIAGIRKVTAANLRLPSALYAIAGALLTMLFAYEILGLDAAVLAGLALAASYQYISQGRFGRVDMTLCFFETLSLFAFLRWLPRDATLSGREARLRIESARALLAGCRARSRRAREGPGRRDSARRLDRHLHDRRASRTPASHDARSRRDHRRRCDRFELVSRMLLRRALCFSQSPARHRERRPLLRLAGRDGAVVLPQTRPAQLRAAEPSGAGRRRLRITQSNSHFRQRAHDLSTEVASLSDAEGAPRSAVRAASRSSTSPPSSSSASPPTNADRICCRYGPRPP